MKVTQFMRKPSPGQFSIETLFETVRQHFDPRVECRVVRCPCVSRGLFRRIWNTIHAFLERGAVNHITGDVHYLALLLPRSRTVLTVHDSNALDRMKGWRRKLYHLFWFRLPMKRARVITVISEETRQRLMRDFPKCADKIVVVPDCISQSFQPLAKPPPGERPVVLQVGTKSNKNVIRLAEALRDMKCRLEIVGRLSKEQEQALQRNQINYGCCWDISENELIQKYGRADLLAFVSTAEGFGLPILEAQTIGRPVVTSNISSMPEVAGEGACFVDPFSVESIRSGIKRVLADSAYQDYLVRAGAENVKRFSAAEVARRYAAVYKALPSKRGAQAQKNCA